MPNRKINIILNKLVFRSAIFIVISSLFFAPVTIDAKTAKSPKSAKATKKRRKSKRSLTAIQKDFTKYQVKQDYKRMARLLEEMLASGYQTVERYKTLGDLYFFIKEDKKALETFRRQAKWANTAKVWENLSDLLLWKRQNDEGRAALEKAVKLDPKNQQLLKKMAGVYEYHTMVEKAEPIWKKLYEASGKSLETGSSMVEFYLRNGKLQDAEKLLRVLKEKFKDLGPKMNTFYLKVLVWNNHPVEAFQTLQKMNLEDLSGDYLEYSFKIAIQGGDMDLAEGILQQLKKQGSDIWPHQLEIFLALGDTIKVREMVQERIDDKGESTELLKTLYASYRSERNLEKEVEVLEKLIKLDANNRQWQDKLTRYYIFHQKYEQGIDLYNDILDDQENLDLLRLDLARLYLSTDQYDDLVETLQKITDPNLEKNSAELLLQAAIYSNDEVKQYEAVKKLLASMESTYLEKREQEGWKEEESLAQKYYKQSEGSKKVKYTDDALEVRYIDLLSMASDLALRNEQYEERKEYGKRYYEAVKQQYQINPNPTWMRRLVLAGIDYATPEEQEMAIIEGIEKYPSHFFYLQYYRFLMKMKRTSEANDILQLLEKNSKTLSEQKLTAEHTFGFVSNEKSREFFSALMTKDPSYITGLKRLGQISLYTKKYASAIFYFEQYLRHSPHDAEIIFSMGEAQANRHYYSDAEDSFQRTVELLDHPKRELYEDELLAIAYMRLGDTEKALNILKKSLKASPNSESLKLNIMENYAILERWQDTLDIINKENLDKIDPLRVGIIKQQALANLDRDKEGLQVLKELLVKYPKDKDLLTVFAYFYSRKGEYYNALQFFERAKAEKPLYEELNQDYRRLKRRYSMNLGLETTFNDATDSSQNKNRIYYGFMVGESDKIQLQAQQYSGEEKNGELRKTKGTMLEAAYLGTLPGTQQYELHVVSQDQVGYKAVYSYHYSFIQNQISFFQNLPSYDSLGLVLAEARTSGYQITFNFQVDKIRQSYLLNYRGRNYNLKDSNDADISTSESTLEAGFTQSLFSYPNRLSLSASYNRSRVSGDETFLVVDQTQTELKASLGRNWNEYFQTTIEYFSGEEKEASKKYAGWMVGVNFVEDDWLIGSYYRSISEKYEIQTIDSTEISLNAEMQF